MRILFTCGHNPVSTAICYLTKEPMSHVAIEVEDYIIHSALLGTQIVTKKDFLDTHTVIAALPMSRYKLRSILAMLEEDASYDFPGLLYLGLRYALKRVFGWSIPKVNLWTISGIYTCTEFVTKVISETEDSMITPYQLYLRLGGTKP